METKPIEDVRDGHEGVETRVSIFGGLWKKVSLVAVPFCFAVCLVLLLRGIRQEKLKEKFVDLQSFIELLSLSGSAYKDENTFFEIMHEGIKYIDGLPHVFAALYDEDLAILSYRSPEEGTAPFDPRRDSHFLELLNAGNSGTVSIVWEDLEGGITKREMFTCFQWVEVPNSGRLCLAAAGISAYSLVSPSLSVFIGIVLGILTISFLLMLGFAIYIIRDICGCRGRDEK